MKKRALGLVEYSSSEDEAQDATAQAQAKPKRRKLPPLPSTITVPVPVDNPAFHQGRTRTAPHVEGQYAAYVYIPLKVPRRSPLYIFLREVLTTAKAVVPILHLTGISDGQNNEPNEIKETLELRVSLTRPIYLRAHQREEFKVAIRAIAKDTEKFTASFAQFAELVNDEKTRTFLTLEIGAGHSELKAICDALTPIVHTFRQKQFYDEPRFHASVAWALLAKPEASAQCGAEAESEAPRTRGLGGHSAVPSTGKPPNSGSMATDSNVTAFPTVPRLPPELIEQLRHEFGSRLLSRNVGAVDMDEMCVRIGKEVTRWRLGGG